MGTINVPVIEPKNLKAKASFFVMGEQKGMPGKSHISGQMFVELYVPLISKCKWPIVFFHGAGQTNQCWLYTPDGRSGWADYFVEQGYTVYLVEQPARGRSAYHPEDDGRRIYHSMEDIEERFTSSNGKWKQAKLHNQWPDGGEFIGSPIFQQFAASQVEYLPDNRQTQHKVLDAIKNLLQITGPAILLTHSQSGPFGWLIADYYPEYIKGIISLEPSGPPFSTDLKNKQAKNYGLAELPLHFEPQIKSPSDFELKLAVSEKEEEYPGWVLANNLYQLPNLHDKKILLITGEASYHASYDWLTSLVMKQLGIHHDFVRLADVGIHGNGHMMMLEKNNLEIADFIMNWIQRRIKTYE